MAYGNYFHVSYPGPGRATHLSLGSRCRQMAQFLHDNPRAWTQITYARDAFGAACDPESDEAASFCLMGLLKKFVRDHGMIQTIVEVLHSVTNHISVPAWNDDPFRTVGDVENALMRAADRIDRLYRHQYGMSEQQQLDALVPFAEIMKHIEKEALAAA